MERLELMRCIPILAIAGSLALCTPCAIQSVYAGLENTTIIVRNGDPAPDGNGTIISFNQPVLNGRGQVAIGATMIHTTAGADDNTALFRGDATSLTVIIREGDSAPDGDGVFVDFDTNHTALNEAGQVAFHATLTGTADDEGVFRGDGAMLTQIARKGDLAPDGDGTFSDFDFDFATLNEAGQVAFKGLLTGTTQDSGVFVGDGRALTQVVRKGDTAPDGDGTFDSVFLPQTPRVNNGGQVAFVSTLSGTNDDRGVFRGDGTTVTQIARDGDPAPDGNGTFRGFSFNELNDVGQVAFEGLLQGTSDPSSELVGMFRGDGTSLTQIARGGSSAPDGNGKFHRFGTRPSLNNSGQAAFRAELTDTSGGTTDDTGLFLGDGVTLTQIVREGDPAPDGNGVFGSIAFDVPLLNDAGQVAFLAYLTDTAGGANDDRGIYLYDQTRGLVQAVREGDSFLGSTVFLVVYRNGAADVHNGLNERGHVAFEYSLSDGRSGIAIWAIPEPTSLALSVLGAVTLMTRRRGVHRR